MLRATRFNVILSVATTAACCLVIGGMASAGDPVEVFHKTANDQIFPPAGADPYKPDQLSRTLQEDFPRPFV